MRNNGESNPVTYLLMALVAAGGFYAFHVAPLYWDNLEAKEAAAEALNVWYTQPEETAKGRLLIRLNTRTPGTSHYELDEDGVESLKPGFGLTEDNIQFIEAAGKRTVRIEYDRIIEFAPLKKRKLFHLVAEKSEVIKK